jgi:outer membrane protein assembly factor BamB
VRDAEARLVELQRTLDQGNPYRLPETGDMIGYSSSTPVTDGHAVYQVFGDGMAAAFTMEGRRLWTVYLGESAHPMNGFDKGHSASPLLVGGKLIVPFGRLQALDAETGRVLWRGAKYADYGTPAVAHVGRLDVLVLPDGSLIRASDGFVLAHGLAEVRYSGPVVQNGVAYFVGTTNAPEEVAESTPGRARAIAIRPGPDNSVTTQPLFDIVLPGVRYYASPIVRDGLIYTVSERGILSALAADSGAKVWEKKITEDGEPNDQFLVFFPSLAFAGDSLYVSGQAGELFSTTWVLQPGRSYFSKGRHRVGAFNASPIVAGGRLYIRGLQELFCVDPDRTRSGVRP